MPGAQMGHCGEVARWRRGSGGRVLGCVLRVLGEGLGGGVRFSFLFGEGINVALP